MYTYYRFSLQPFLRMLSTKTNVSSLICVPSTRCYASSGTTPSNIKVIDLKTVQNPKLFSNDMEEIFSVRKRVKLHVFVCSTLFALSLTTGSLTAYFLYRDILNIDEIVTAVNFKRFDVPALYGIMTTINCIMCFLSYRIPLKIWKYKSDNSFLIARIRLLKLEQERVSSCDIRKIHRGVLFTHIINKRRYLLPRDSFINAEAETNFGM
ncbi:hypothetical protein GJ496_005593 [Pomphorhynchus laevis]|nr:hypothetical protein GJ496_005593 [Pomphorhynchus laevis]